MYLALIETTTGPMTIGLIDLAQDEMDGPFDALINLLMQVSNPIVVTSTDTFVREVPEDTPATLTVKYLGAKSAEFSDQDAFGASMNEHFARGVFQCPSAFQSDESGKITASFEYFELVAEDLPRQPTPPIH